jgi:hypothetical protein
MGFEEATRDEVLGVEQDRRGRNSKPQVSLPGLREAIQCQFAASLAGRRVDRPHSDT